eukprot:1887882-Alexandrium_andersonii.AAC.1
MASSSVALGRCKKPFPSCPDAASQHRIAPFHAAMLPRGLRGRARQENAQPGNPGRPLRGDEGHGEVV